MFCSFADQLNTAVQSTMKTTPFELVFGQPPRTTIFPGVTGHVMEEDVEDLLMEGLCCVCDVEKLLTEGLCCVCCIRCCSFIRCWHWVSSAWLSGTGCPWSVFSLTLPRVRWNRVPWSVFSLTLCWKWALQSHKVSIIPVLIWWLFLYWTCYKCVSTDLMHYCSEFICQTSTGVMTWWWCISHHYYALSTCHLREYFVSNCNLISHYGLHWCAGYLCKTLEMTKIGWQSLSS